MAERARPVLTVEDGEDPLFLRLARAVADDVRRRRLRPGDALPGSRALAESLGVNRNTVVAAYRELVAEGWAVARPGGGTFVAEAVPEPRPRALARALRPTSVTGGTALALRPEAGRPAPPPAPPGTLVLAGGSPDTRLFPTRLLARAVRRVLTSAGAHRALGYGDPRGDERLRAAVADLLREARGVPARAGNVLVTQGSQMGLELVARAVVPDAGLVAVEDPGYPPAWAAFERAGARLLPVAVDRHGLDVDALARLASRTRLSAVYVTPHHQYPTTVTLAPGRRLALLELARRRRFAVVEDDYDHELHYAGRPVLPLASADTQGVVVYLGTLSKVLAPGLRLAYVVASEAMIDRLARDRFVVDRQGDHVIERAAAELLEDGTVARHVRKLRRVYEGRRDWMIDLLGRAFGDRIQIEAPSGGMALWPRVRLPPAEIVAWERRALAHGVWFMAGERLSWRERSLPFVRLGFAPLDEDEAREAVRRLALAFPGPLPDRRDA